MVWPSYKKFILVILGAILGASFFFRENISWLLDFGVEESRPEVVSGVVVKETVAPPSSSAPVVKQYVPPPTPSYTGRDPDEIRPVPEEVKLFTEEQRERLYTTIQTHARVVKETPTYFWGWIQLGILKKIIGDFEGARDAWEYAGIIEPLNSLSFANLGELYWRYLRDFPKAEENLKISIRHKPNDIQTYVTLAELYHYSLKEKYDLAPQVLLDGMGTNNEPETLLRRLAYLYEQRGELARALEWWEKVFQKNPEDSEVADKISKLKSKLGGSTSQ